MIPSPAGGSRRQAPCVFRGLHPGGRAMTDGDHSQTNLG